MERWVGKVAIVTGASVGIGAAITIDLLKAGVIVVGLARRVDLIEEVRKKVPASVAIALHAIKCDVTIEADILAAFEFVEHELDGVDILINNAAIAYVPGNFVDANNTAVMREILDTNVLALVLCTREAFQSMKRRGVDGHVIILSSVCGRFVPCLPGAGSLNMYVASKHALTAITEQMRQEFQTLGTNIKITNIAPGVVDTDLVPVKTRQLGTPMLRSEDVSATVLYVLSTPPHVQVQELIVRVIGERL